MVIADNSPEAEVIEAIISRDHVSVEEVVRRALRAMAMQPWLSPTKSVVSHPVDWQTPNDKSLYRYGYPLGVFEED